MNNDSEHTDGTLDEEYKNWKKVYYENVTALRDLSLTLPDTVTVLEKPCGSKVYIVGTAHFSEESIADVINIMEKTVPDCVILELCRVRSQMLLMDDETMKQQMSKANLWDLMKREGHSNGLMHYLMLRMSNHLMEQIKMLPGGEFRAAFNKAKDLPCCHVTLGDRQIDVTLKRALGSLGLAGRLKFFFALLLGLKPISKEEIEKMKKADILEELLKELGHEFPSLSRVIVEERDRYLTRSIWDAVHPIDEEGEIPSINVAVVGIGHSAGIIKNWNNAEDIDQKQLCSIEKQPLSWTLFVQILRMSALTVVGVFCYKLSCGVYNVIRSSL